MQAATPFAVLEQQRLYLVSALSRTRIIIDGLTAKLASVEQTLASSSNIPRPKRKKLQHTRWRARTTLRNCENEQHALFENLRACEAAIFHASASHRARSFANATTTHHLAHQEYHNLPPQSWFPHHSIDPSWLEQATRLVRPGAPAPTLFATQGIADGPYRDSLALAPASAAETWHAGWSGWQWSPDTPGPGAGYPPLTPLGIHVPSVSVDPLDADGDGDGAGLSPGPIECVDETGLTHYIYGDGTTASTNGHTATTTTAKDREGSQITTNAAAAAVTKSRDGSTTTPPTTTRPGPPSLQIFRPVPTAPAFTPTARAQPLYIGAGNAGTHPPLYNCAGDYTGIDMLGEAIRTAAAEGRGQVNEQASAQSQGQVGAVGEDAQAEGGDDDKRNGNGDRDRDGHGEANAEEEEPKRRYSAAAVDLLLYRFSHPELKAKKGRGHRKSRSSVGNLGGMLFGDRDRGEGVREVKGEGKEELKEGKEVGEKDIQEEGGNEGKEGVEEEGKEKEEAAPPTQTTSPSP